jgi:hypothetical protein
LHPRRGGGSIPARGNGGFAKTGTADRWRRNSTLAALQISEHSFVSIVRLTAACVLVAPLACALAGCSSSGNVDDPDAWYNKTVVENIVGREKPPPDYAATTSLPPDYAAGASPQAVGTVPPDYRGAPPPGVAVAAAPVDYRTAPAATRPGVVPVAAVPGTSVPPSELYRSEVSCGSAGPAGAAPIDIALDMSECEVARRYGLPDRVDLGAMPNGARSLTLSYLRVARPRIYHFAAGRLVSIENLPEPRDRRAARSGR